MVVFHFSGGAGRIKLHSSASLSFKPPTAIHLHLLFKSKKKKKRSDHLAKQPKMFKEPYILDQKNKKQICLEQQKMKSLI